MNFLRMEDDPNRGRGVDRSAPCLVAVALALGAAAVLFGGSAAARADERRPLASHAPVTAASSATVRPHVTFSGEIVRLLRANCQGCHHDGGIAPFPLVTYEDAYAHRTQIQIVTTTVRMPPWKADAGCATFAGDPRLSTRTSARSTRGCSPGRRRAIRPSCPRRSLSTTAGRSGLPTSSSGCRSRSSRTSPRATSTAASVSRPASTRSAISRAWRSSPGNRTMVDHVLLFADTSNASAALDGKDTGSRVIPASAGPGSPGSRLLGAWVPGTRNAFLPEGIGIDLPAGAPVVMQVHYSARTGGVAPDLTRVGLHFSRVAVQKRLLTLPLVNLTFRLPAGESAIPVTASFGPVPFAITLRSIAPHMHLLGRTMKVSVAPFGGGPAQCLVNVKDWDFRWQGFYAYRTPLPIPLFATLSLEATYDNSVGNPNNPNLPPKDVRWGEATSDEMCLAYLSFTLDNENLSGAPGCPRRTSRRSTRSGSARGPRRRRRRSADARRARSLPRARARPRGGSAPGRVAARLVARPAGRDGKGDDARRVPWPARGRLLLPRLLVRTASNNSSSSRTSRRPTSGTSPSSPSRPTAPRP